MWHQQYIFKVRTVHKKEIMSQNGVSRFDFFETDQKWRLFEILGIFSILF